MKESITNRVIKVSNYLITTKQTIRDLASHFNISKSTIHKDLQYRLPTIDKELSQKVNEILTLHLKTRHLNGGEATKRKYLQNRDGK